MLANFQNIFCLYFNKQILTEVFTWDIFDSTFFFSIYLSTKLFLNVLQNIDFILVGKTSVFMHSKEQTGVGESSGNSNFCIIDLFVVEGIDKINVLSYLCTNDKDTDKDMDIEVDRLRHWRRHSSKHQHGLGHKQKRKHGHFHRHDYLAQSYNNTYCLHINNINLFLSKPNKTSQNLLCPLMSLTQENISLCRLSWSSLMVLQLDYIINYINLTI